MGSSGVSGFGNKILTVKHMIELLRRGIGPLTMKAQHTQHSKVKKWVYRVTQKLLDNLCCCLQYQVTFSVTLYIHTKNEVRTCNPGIAAIQDRGRTRSPCHCDWV